MLTQLLLLSLTASDPIGAILAPRPLAQARLITQRPAPVGTTRGDETAMYKKVAASTVLVRLEGSYGSGVVISKDGLILTNHHVAASGRIENLTVTAHITRGRLTAEGVMERLDEPLLARVLSWNPDSDVALLKLDAAPADLVFAPLASKPVTPGAQVYALGHGGIGLLWSMRVCNVTAVGVRDQTALAVVRVLDKKGAAPAGGRAVIQTNCPITHGDSGGPLFNEAGEVTGLNDYFRQDWDDERQSFSGSSTWFHVELRHLKELADTPPSAAMLLTPNPWAAGGKAVLSDLDGDGAPDSLGLVRGRRTTALMIDGLQRTAAGAAAAVEKKKAFPAHVVLFEAQGGRMLQVGQTLLALDGSTIKAAYAVKQGKASALAQEAWPKKWNDALPALPAEAAARVNQLVEWANPELGAGAPLNVPGLVAGEEAQDRDGVRVKVEQTAIGFAVLADPESVDLKSAFKPRLGVFANTMTERLQLVFDTDGDAQWDRSVVIATTGGVAELARADVRGAAGWVAAPKVEQVDPHWASATPAGTERVRKLLSRMLSPELVAGQPQWPPLSSLEGEVQVLARNKGKGKEALLVISGDDDAYVLAGNVQGTEGVTQRLAKGTLKPAFVLVSAVKGMWALYDWNVDGKTDLALLSDDDGVIAAYSLQKDGSFNADEAAKQGAFIRWKAFKSPELRKFARASFAAAFDPEQLER